MKAPEKIYLQVCGDCKDNSCKNCKFENLEDNVTWCKDKIFDKDVEYTRTELFIEKAAEWLKKNADDYTWYDESEGESGMTDEFIEVFENYMKGEKS